MSGSTKNGETKVSFSCEEYDVRNLLQPLFRFTRKRFQIDPAVQGRVTVSAKDIDFDSALRILLKAADATYRMEDGTYVITRLP